MDNINIVRCWGNNYEGQLGLPNGINANANLDQDQDNKSKEDNFQNLVYFIDNFKNNFYNKNRKHIKNRFIKSVLVSSE